jgi:hypothetical protein
MFIHQKNQGKKLPRPVSDYMRYRFNLPQEYLGVLRYIEQEKPASENRARSISIFSPIRARERHLSIRTTQDLGHYPEMVLFNGHFDGRGKVYIADRRSPVWQC